MNFEKNQFAMRGSRSPWAVTRQGQEEYCKAFDFCKSFGVTEINPSDASRSPRKWIIKTARAITPLTGWKETKEDRKEEVKAHICKQKPSTVQPCNRCSILPWDVLGVCGNTPQETHSQLMQFFPRTFTLISCCSSMSAMTKRVCWAYWLGVTWKLFS